MDAKEHIYACTNCEAGLILYPKKNLDLTQRATFIKNGLIEAGWRKNPLPLFGVDLNFICKSCFIKMTVDRLKGIKPFDPTSIGTTMYMGSGFGMSIATNCTLATSSVTMSINYGIKIMNPQAAIRLVR